MGKIFTVADLRPSGWRETLEEKWAYEDERRKRELAKEQEQQQARKTHEAEVASANWYDAVDTRIRRHFKDWAWAAIDERIQQWLEGKLEPLKDAIGSALGKKAAQVRDEFKRVIEEQQRSLETKLVEQAERHDGRIEASLARERDATSGAQTQLREEVKRAIAETVDAFETEISALEQRLRAVPGRLPVVKVYRPDTVHYAGHLVTHQGATYQALRDTARAPPHVDDWVCVASGGRDGQSVRVRGAFNTTANDKRFDIVSFDGTAFIARRDNPGIPGISEDGWQMLVPRGKAGDRGPPGSRGMKGERGTPGEDAPTIVSWTLDQKNYRAIPTLSNGTQGTVIELRGLFEQFVLEVGYMAGE